MYIFEESAPIRQLSIADLAFWQSPIVHGRCGTQAAHLSRPLSFAKHRLQNFMHNVLYEGPRLATPLLLRTYTWPTL